jgi:CBS domain-containing protein/anti-sigma regulatory factor (Ser/Thr protein kinase)
MTADNMTPSAPKLTDAAAGQITRIEELSYELKIADVMSPIVRTTRPDMKMLDLLDLFRSARISGAPVVVDSKLVGIVSIEDVIRYLQPGPQNARVVDYMSHSVITTRATDPVVEAMEMFGKTHVGRLPVVDNDGKLVGIITKGDVTRGVLKALQSDYQVEEVRRYRASHLFEDIESDRTSLILRYNVTVHDFEHGGQASSNIKRALLRLGADAQLARRCGIAIYEAEMNLIIHTTSGGYIRIEIEPHRILMKTTDDGPGIADIDKALKAGYSTAPDWIREMGFGAGMGLQNIKRCVDGMKLSSTAGGSTKLEMEITLQPEENLGLNYRLLGGETPE